ncbi:gas vesicle protein [Actinomadura sp. 21ATH]|uniref:gas vesicle protein n=1 Tax=Actinomadura sp. 21ATH TaxID=1735444 RepID=UPI0035BFCA18
MDQDRRPAEARRTGQGDGIVRPSSVERSRTVATRDMTTRDLSGRPVGGLRPMEPQRGGDGGLAHVVEVLLDKGLVINADIMVSVAGVELLGIRLRAALASFETAARYGLEFPSGTNLETAAWKETEDPKESCPECGKRTPTQQLLNEFCPWCGWRSAKALAEAARDGGPDDSERDADAG